LKEKNIKKNNNYSQAYAEVKNKIFMKLIKNNLCKSWFEISFCLY